MQVLALWIAIVALSAMACWLIALPLVQRGQRIALLVVLFGLAAIGATAGITGGLSRDGAVGDIISAALGLLGGVVIWLFAADQTKGTVVSLCAVAFSLSLFVGFFEAAARRSNPDSYDFWRAECVAKFTDKDILNDKVAFIMLDKSMGSLCAQIFTNEKETLLKAGAKSKAP